MHRLIVLITMLRDTGSVLTFSKQGNEHLERLHRLPKVTGNYGSTGICTFVHFFFFFLAVQDLSCGMWDVVP